MRSPLAIPLMAALLFAGAMSRAEDAPLRFTVAEAVQAALERNPSLRVQQLRPQIVRTREDAARAAFDPTLSGALSRSRREAPQSILQGDATNGISATQAVREATDAALAASVLLPTGTRVNLGGGTTVQDQPTELADSRAGIVVTQPLLQGMGTAANLAELRQARLETRISVFELRGFTLALVAEVERACWMVVQSEHQLAAFRDAMRIAEQQAAETQERIRVGKMAELEAVAAQAEVASRREGLINAESIRSLNRLHLVRLLNPDSGHAWGLEFEVTDPPHPPETPLESVEQFVTVALAERPDLNQARLLLERDELEVVRTRNGLLPKLDVFASLGRSGYAESFTDSLGGREGDGADSMIGVRLEYAFFNRAAKADNRRAALSRMQAAEALTNLCHLAQADVRAAWIEAERARAQVAATAATMTLQEKKLEAEQVKFREGKSTALLVAQAERDRLQSRLEHVRSVAAALIARTALYRQDGSLLARRGIVVKDP